MNKKESKGQVVADADIQALRRDVAAGDPEAKERLKHVLLRSACWDDLCSKCRVELNIKAPSQTCFCCDIRQLITCFWCEIQWISSKFPSDIKQCHYNKSWIPRLPDIAGAEERGFYY